LKLLTIDLETSPNLAHVWGLWQQNVGLSQLLESGEVICFAAKWYGDEQPMFFSKFHHGKKLMVKTAHELLDQADAVIHFNGKQVVKKNFRFPSNKLDYVTKKLGLDHKVQNSGHQLWVKCMAGDYQAWEEMKEYNLQDVVITEQLYDKLLPWISSHPSHGLYEDGEGQHCPNCGSANLKREGKAYTALSVYQRYSCGDCGKWSRGNKRLDGVDVRGVQ
jgi:predicted RNA-binding Zn-ribbon protein involved in translation (DUF1610 family)